MSTNDTIEEEKEVAMNSKGTVTLAFLMGAVAGSLTSLLLAPKSGEETRERLRDRAKELKDKGRERAGAARHKAESMTGAVKRAASEAKHAYQEELERASAEDKPAEPTPLHGGGKGR